MNTLSRKVAAGVCGGILLGYSGVGLAAGQNGIQAQMQGKAQGKTTAALANPVNSVRSISGGVGKDSQEEMQRLKKDYNVHMLFADQPSGAYLADVRVQVMNNQRGLLVDKETQGPYFYLQLPEGEYTIKAMYEGVEKTQQIKVKDKSSRNDLRFYWKDSMNGS